MNEQDRTIAREALENVVDAFYLGRIEGTKFTISYIPEKMLMLSMLKEGNLLTRLKVAFTEEIGYRPFCKYTEPESLGSLKTYEWAKDDAIERIVQLKAEGKKIITLFL
jgi:hypothetical protein